MNKLQLCITNFKLNLWLRSKFNDQLFLKVGVHMCKSKVWLNIHQSEKNKDFCLLGCDTNILVNELCTNVLEKREHFLWIVDAVYQIYSVTS